MDLDVLLIEDDAATARALQKLLESVGMTVHLAKSVAQAMERLAGEPSLVILDLMLPDGSGLEVLKAIRGSEMDCKVAVVSAASDSELFAGVTALKPDAVFGKPLEFGDFVDWISSIFTEDPVAAFKLAG